MKFDIYKTWRLNICTFFVAHINLFCNFVVEIYS